MWFSVETKNSIFGTKHKERVSKRQENDTQMFGIYCTDVRKVPSVAFWSFRSYQSVMWPQVDFLPGEDRVMWSKAPRSIKAHWKLCKIISKYTSRIKHHGNRNTQICLNNVIKTGALYLSAGLIINLSSLCLRS